jgi:hypothetical protein
LEEIFWSLSEEKLKHRKTYREKVEIRVEKA